MTPDERAALLAARQAYLRRNGRSRLLQRGKTRATADRARAALRASDEGLSRAEAAVVLGGLADTALRHWLLKYTGSGVWPLSAEQRQRLVPVTYRDVIAGVR